MPTIDVSVTLGVDDGHSLPNRNPPLLLSGEPNISIGETIVFGEVNGFARFQNVTILQGSTIDVAFLTVVGEDSANDGADVRTNIFFNDIDDAVAPTTAAGHEALARTTAFTAWDSVDFVVDVNTNSDSIVAVVQEVVDRTGWSSGNAMMLLWDDDGSINEPSFYDVYSFEGTGNDILLHVEYTEPVLATDPSEMVRTLLSDNWTPGNTDSRTPIFITSVDAENISSRQNDVIKVFESRPRNKTRQDHQYIFATRTAVVTVQVDIGFTPSGVTLPLHSARVLEEVERVIQSQRSNPDTYWELLEQDTFTFQHQYRNFARNIMNVNCKRIVRQIPGS